MLCPAAEDAALCEEYVRGYWSEITAAMYPKFLDPKDVCKRLGACTKDIRTFLSTPTCDSAVDPSPGSLRSSAPPSRMPRSSPSCRVTGAQELKMLRPVNRVSPI